MKSNSLLGRILQVPLEDLETHPQNPRRGDVAAIAESLSANGQFQPIVVQASTNYILAGNHTYLAARSLQWDTIDVVYVDVEADAATKILLAANRTADLGGYDEFTLAALLGEIREEDEALLAGTGYSAEDVDELLADALIQLPDMDESDREANVTALRVLDRLFPAANALRGAADQAEGVLRDLDMPVSAGEPLGPKRAPKHAPSDWVLFRFGELRAKVSRGAYEGYFREWVALNGGDTNAAGVAAAVQLGLVEQDVRVASPEGQESWS